jgi:UDP-2,3-diacylglucosamine pyrophosphatase LpxH
MSTLAVVVSDLHMGADRPGTGQRDPLERFTYDRQFRTFCRELADYAGGRGDTLHFILNGDVVDLWTTVDADELGSNAAPIIEQRLEYPAPRGNQAAEDKAVARGERQLDRILAAHPEVALGLLEILELPEAKRRIIYLVGNHDHAMMWPRLQQYFCQRLGEIMLLDGPAPMEFPGRYENPALALYVEHGQQFSLDSAYTNFFDPGEADLGLYFLRFVGNRIRAHYANNKNGLAVAILSELLAWTVSRATLDPLPLPPALRFLLEYFDARKRNVVPSFSAHTLLEALYQGWDRTAGQPPNIIKHALAEVFRTHQQPEFQRVLAIESDPAYLIRDIGIRGTRRLVDWDSQADRYWAGAMSRVSQPAKDFPRLDPATYSTVVLGHTHKSIYQFMTAPGMVSGRYINSGSWTRDKRPSFAWVSDRGNPREWRGLKEYPK